MLKNHLKIALRQIVKNKFFSMLNIVGLALGMSSSLLIWLWVKEELAFDRFLPQVDQVYAVRVNYLQEGSITTSTNTNGLLAEVLSKDISQVHYATKVQYPEDLLLKIAGKEAIKERGFYATTDFFKVFPFPTRFGNPHQALQDRSKIIITHHTAEKLFGTDQVLGKQVQFNNDQYYTIGAVLENLPATSSLQFDWLINYQVQEQDWKKRWGNTFCMTFVRLHEQASQKQAEVGMNDIFSRYTDWEQAKNIQPVLQPMQQVHLYTQYENGQARGGRIEYVRIFMLVAGFILLIACINFMNLATARAARRAKEVGVRKVVGAQRATLMGQFLTESFLTSTLAIAGALLLTALLLPTFNQLFDQDLALDLMDPIVLGSILVLVLVTGVVAGSYPALFLSALPPIRILKGTLRFGTSAAQFRRVLVVFQFMLSSFLLMGMLGVGWQMHYIQTKQLGLDWESILYTAVEGELNNVKRMETLRQELLRSPAIASATVSMILPQNIQASSSDLDWAGRDPKKDNQVSAMAVGYDFARTMGIQLVDGRDFSKDWVSDSSAYLINESASKMMSMENPVGKLVSFWHGKGPVIGVIKDFHLQSLYQPITPLILCLDPQNASYLLLRTQGGKTSQALTDLEKLSKQFNPNYPFQYHFADEEYERMYQSERQVSALINYFGVLAMLISCLGLLGLAAFTAQQRQKEIGIRKVLGASVGSVVALLSKDFLKLVVVALLLATPLAIWTLDKWLHSFQYSVTLSWWIFGLASLLALIIALLTVSLQSVKAALMNPVKSLRSE